MILDTSALIAIFLEEAGSESLLEKTRQSEIVFVGAPIAFEAAMVLGPRLKRDPRPLLDGLLRRLNAEIVDFTAIHYEAAVSAFMRFGKRRHRAGLNFGDCMSYALAKVSGLPLLYAGADFSYTDIESA